MTGQLILSHALSKAPRFPIDSERAVILAPAAGTFTLPVDPLIEGLRTLEKSPREAWQDQTRYEKRRAEFYWHIQLLEVCRNPGILEPCSHEWESAKRLYAFDIWDNRRARPDTNTFSEDGQLAEIIMRSQILVVHRRPDQ